jgi:hypothetical protein
VSPYLQVLALFKIFQRRMHPTLFKQDLQTIKYNKATHQQVQLSSLNSLSYLYDDCGKQAILISESREDSN